MSELKNQKWECYHVPARYRIKLPNGVYFDIPDSVKQSVQYAIGKLPETLAELERVKKENQKLREFVRQFYNLKNPSAKQWFEITETAHQLLNHKSQKNE